MKSTTGSSITQSRTSAKATSKTNGSRGPQALPARKAKSAKALPPGTSAPQNHDSQPTAHSADTVRARAYLNYQKRGSEDGDHTDDWLRAEAELANERHQGLA